jgi:hypothetical protein
MAVPVLSLNYSRQFVHGIQMLISGQFRDWVRVCVVSQIALLIFQDFKAAMQSVLVGQVLLNWIGGAMTVLRLL